MRKLLFVLYVLAFGASVASARETEVEIYPQKHLALVDKAHMVWELPKDREGEWTCEVGYEPMPEETEPTPEPTPEPDKYWYGTCRITYYCNCEICCGGWAGGATASGATPCAGWTVANGSLPFGTRVLINGHEYCVEDRGVGGEAFDIYCDSHDQALSGGLYYTDVYIIE